MNEKLRESAIQAAWKTGNLKYKLRESQRKIYDARKNCTWSRKFVNCCGRGWGKSFLLFTFCCENAFKYPGSDSVFVAPVLRKVAEYLEPIARDVLQDCPENFKPDWNRANLVYTFPNGSRIIVCGSNQKAFDNIRGGTFKLAVVDEGAYHDYLIELIERVLMPALNKGNGYLVLSSTPPDIEHPFDQRYCTEAELGDYYFHATIYDAGYPPDQIAEFKREAGWKDSDNSWKSPTHELNWKIEYMAERGLRNPDKTIIPSWDDKYIGDFIKDQFYPFFFKFESIDIGTKHDLTVILFGYYHYLNATLVFEDEWYCPGPEFTTLKLASLIKIRERNLWGSIQPTLRVSDISDIQNDLNVTHNLSFVGVSKTELHSMVNRFNLLVESGRVRVSKKCKLLIQTLKNGIWDKNREEFAHSETGLGHMDALAAAIYTHQSFESWYNQNPIPLTLNADRFNSMDMHNKLDSTKNEWQKVFEPLETDKFLEDTNKLPEINDEDYWIG